jgi:penicillin-binding protein 2
VIRELERRDGEPGEDLVTSIDAELQRYTMQRLGEESASVVVMDVNTGEVLVLASAPAYDPNTFIGGIKPAVWRGLLDNPRAPLRNKAVAGTYPPGSTFKMAVALAGLASGTLNPQGTVYCPGFLNYGNFRFHCWKAGGHGSVALAQAIQRSCDVYFYNKALDAGIDALGAMCHRLGFGDRLGLDLPGEAPGIIPNDAWKQANYGEPWRPGDTINSGIGQGFVTTTPVQLATYVARIANGGYQVVPRLKKLLPGEPLPHFDRLDVPDEWLLWIRNAMGLVVNDPGGTAYRSRIEDPTFRMGGKTGTVQVSRISPAERAAGIRSDAQRPWHLRNHALFVAFAPFEAPRYSISVVLEHGGGGSAAAAPIAKDVLLELQRRLAGGAPQAVRTVPGQTG